MLDADKARLFDELRGLCGFVEDGTSQPLHICQDDATRLWVLTIGNQDHRMRTYTSMSFQTMVQHAIEGEAERGKDEPAIGVRILDIVDGNVIFAVQSSAIRTAEHFPDLKERIGPEEAAFKAPAEPFRKMLARALLLPKT